MAPASRIAARLADLSHAQLVEIAAAGCEASTEVKNRADALLAAHKPLAQWAVEGVLLSSDLVPHLLAPLQLEDGAAAAVCSRWAEGWKATSEGRRRLTRVALDFPQDLLGKRSLDMAVVPGGDAQLVVRSGTTVRILARDMSSCQQLPAAEHLWLHRRQRGVHLHDPRLWATVHCLTHDGTEVASYEDPDKRICNPVLAPGGLLFCVLYEEGDDARRTRSSPSTPRRCSLATGLGCRCSMARVGWWWLARSSSSATPATTGCRSSHSRASTAARSRASGSGP